MPLSERRCRWACRRWGRPGRVGKSLFLHQLTHRGFNLAMVCTSADDSRRAAAGCTTSVEPSPFFSFLFFLLCGCSKIVPSTGHARLPDGVPGRAGSRGWGPTANIGPTFAAAAANHGPGVSRAVAAAASETCIYCLVFKVGGPPGRATLNLQRLLRWHALVRLVQQTLLPDLTIFSASREG